VIIFHDPSPGENVEMISYQTIQISERGPLTRVTLNRPEVRNALNETMIKEILQVFRSLGEDSSTRVILLEGAGEAFCAGLDLEYILKSGRAEFTENIRLASELAQMYRTIYENPKAVVAKVHGPVVAGGFGLVAVSDLAVSEEKARFSLSEIKIGLIPALIGPYCVKKIGHSHFCSLGITGSWIDAVEARHMGLIQEIAPSEELEKRTIHIVNKLLKAAPGAITKFKAYCRSMNLQDSPKLIAAIQASEEGQEGASAFLEKRPPKWVDHIDEG
jgi:methylglutaconyl-CoA hydratase